MSTIERRALEWAMSRDTGRSSEAIAAHMLGCRGETSYPHDNDDLGRCIRLLDKIPEWRPRLGEMASVSPMWKALAENWAELEALYREDPQSERLYARMKALLRPAEDASGRIVRIGKNISVEFGR